MTERSFDDGFWNDSFVQKLEKDAKYLFAYLWTNKHCNPAGIYEITLKTIAFETGIETEAIPILLEQCQPKIKWYSDLNIVWVKNFVKRQSKNPKFLIGVAKCLHFLNNGLIKEFIDYNALLGVSIPYQYTMDTVSKGIDSVGIETISDTDTDIVSDIDIKGGSRGDSKIGLIFKTFDDNFQRITEANREVLGDMIDNYGTDEVLIALNKAIKQNKRSLAYVEGILKGKGSGKAGANPRPVRKPEEFTEPT